MATRARAGRIPARLPRHRRPRSADGARRLRRSREGCKDANVKAADGGSDFRFRIEHDQVIAPQQIAQYKKLGVIASVQPSHLLTDMNWAESTHWSEAREELLMRGRSSSTTACARLRHRLSGRADYALPRHLFRRHPQERGRERRPISRTEADHRTGARRLHDGLGLRRSSRRRRKGTLAPGMLADFVVLDRDLTKATPPEILKTKFCAPWSAARRSMTRNEPVWRGHSCPRRV